MNNEIKVTQLPSAEQITQNDLLMIVQNDENKKATSSQFLDMLEDDLENYYTKTETDALLDDKADTSEIPSNDNLVNVGSSVDTDYKVNVITTKNLFDKDNVNSLNAYFVDGTNNITADTSGNNKTIYIPCKPNTTYTIQKTASPSNRAIGYTTTTPAIGVAVQGAINILANTTSKSITTGNNAEYLVIRVWSGTQDTITYQQMLDSLQIEQGNQATTYEAFIPNTINVNNEKYTDTINVGTEINNKNRVNVLYSHNLFDKDNANVLNAYIGTANGTIAALNNGRTIWIPIEANTTYTISKLKSARFVIATYTTQPALNVSGTNVAYDNDATSLTITSGANDKYLAVWLFNGDVDTLTYQQIIDSLMINEGSEALDYEPYLIPSINVDGDEIYSQQIKYDVINVNSSFSSSSQSVIIPNVSKYEYLVCHIRNSYNRLFSIIIDKYVLMDLVSGNYNIISLPTKTISNNAIDSLATGRISYTSGGTITYIYDIPNATFPLTFDRIVCYYR